VIRLTQAIVSVMTCTISAGIVGGIVGAAVGRIAPTFVSWLYSPVGPIGAQNFDAIEFGFGLGTVCGLLMGAGTGLFLVCVLTLRDAWLARAGILRQPKPVRDPSSPSLYGDWNG
jgi:hypothetical protein